MKRNLVMINALWFRNSSILINRCLKQLSGQLKLLLVSHYFWKFKNLGLHHDFSNKKYKTEAWFHKERQKLFCFACICFCTFHKCWVFYCLTLNYKKIRKYWEETPNNTNTNVYGAPRYFFLSQNLFPIIIIMKTKQENVPTIML